jgi:hypothetical protein
MTQVDLEQLNFQSVGFDGRKIVIGGWGVLGDVWNGVKTVVNSPVTKAVAGGIALVIPPVGVPAAAALATATIAIKATESPVTKVSVEGIKVLLNTAEQAKKGDPQAQVAMKAMAVAKAAADATKSALAKSALDKQIATTKATLATMKPAQGVSAGSAGIRDTPASALAGQIARTQATLASMKPAQGVSAGSAGIRSTAGAITTPPGWTRVTEGSYKRA